MLFSVIKDTRSTSGIVDLVTNVDYVPLVNHYLEQRSYPAPAQEQEEEAPKKAAPRAPQGRSSPQRGSGLTASRTRPTKQTTRTIEEQAEKPSVREKLAVCRTEAEQRAAQTVPQRTRPTKSKTR